MHKHVHEDWPMLNIQRQHEALCVLFVMISHGQADNGQGDLVL